MYLGGLVEVRPGIEDAHIGVIGGEDSGKAGLTLPDLNLTELFHPQIMSTLPDPTLQRPPFLFCIFLSSDIQR